MSYLAIIIGLIIYYLEYGYSLPMYSSYQMIFAGGFMVSGLISLLKTINYTK